MRMLRAAKLVGRYGFTLETELERAVRALAQQITVTSRARQFEELLKILTHTQSHATFAACREYGLLRHYWPNLADVWSSPSGTLAHSLLRDRDRRLAAGDYWTSKALALATIAFPAVATALAAPPDEPLWEYRAGIERDCRDAIRDFFAPFPLSRYFLARMRDIILLVPRFLQTSRRGRIAKHPEYKYGRELFSLLVNAYGWSQSLMDPWPPATDTAPTKERAHGRRYRRPRRRRAPRKPRENR